MLQMLKLLSIAEVKGLAKRPISDCQWVFLCLEKDLCGALETLVSHPHPVFPLILQFVLLQLQGSLLCWDKNLRSNFPLSNSTNILHGFGPTTLKTADTVER